jgi:hypothetical protein
MPRNSLDLFRSSLAKVAQGAAGERPEPDCSCLRAAGTKVAEDGECPACTEFGYAVWAVRSGTPAEQLVAAVYLDELERLGELPRFDVSQEKSLDSGQMTTGRTGL